MFGKRCTLCGGKLNGNVCTECGLDNSKSDAMYRGLQNSSSCDKEALTHVHDEEKPLPEAPEAMQGEARMPDGLGTTGYSYRTSQSSEGTVDVRPYRQSKRGKTRNVQKMPARNVVAVIATVIGILGAIAGLVPFVVQEVSSFFSSDVESADQDGRYDYVNYELEDTGESWNEKLSVGEYKVGVHIPEGTYTVTISEGSGVLQVNDIANGIYLWQQFAVDTEEIEESVVEMQDVRLYEGAIVEVGDRPLEFTTENAQSELSYIENPLTEEVMLPPDQSMIAGVDFPEGVYDVLGLGEWGYLEIEVPLERGEDYPPYSIGTVWMDTLDTGETDFENLVLPAGVKVTALGFDENEGVLLIPSEMIGSTDYEAYYLEQNGW
ncbi:MAG: hypothetical protein HFH53_02050 [Hespellia sp.]|nr:hypothetical protein [Hespellia sp.]